jgi:uncharacterized protein
MNRAALLRLLIFQPTKFCNLACEYCYLPQKSSLRRMSLNVLQASAEMVRNSDILGPALKVAFHAGEPLIVGIPWYKDAFAILKETLSKTTLRFSVQTNGTLVSDRWIDCFLRHNVSVSFSLDGPKFLHDARRVFRNGAPSFDRVLAGMRLAQSAGIPLNVLCVLTRESLRYPDEIYDHFLGLNINFLAFNFEEIEGPHRESSLSAPALDKEVYNFFDRFWCRAQVDNFPFQIREFDHLAKVLGACLSKNKITSDVNEAFRILSINTEGMLSTFSPELLDLRDEAYGDFSIGRVNSSGLDSSLDIAKLNYIDKEIQSGIARCRMTCEYFDFCGGGAPINKFSELVGGSCRREST